MNNQQSLMPQAAQPVNRLTTGQLPTELAELSEEILQLNGGDSSASVLASLSDQLVPSGDWDWEHRSRCFAGDYCIK